jgi:hypothetical protein
MGPEKMMGRSGMVEHVHGGLLKWIELHPGTASWVQAIGAIAAIAAAFWIAQGQQRKAERDAAAERDVRAKALSYRILPAVLDIEREIGRIRYVSEHFDYGLKLLLPGANAASHEVEAISEMSIVTTLSNSALLDNSYILQGEAPKTIAQLYWLVATYNDTVSRGLGRGTRHGIISTDQFRSRVVRLLGALETLAKEARELLGPIHDEDQLRSIASRQPADDV